MALYNTAFGLMIAIPSLMFYRYFRGRVDEYQLTMELAAERMVPHLMRFAVRTPAAAGRDRGRAHELQPPPHARNRRST